MAIGEIDFRDGCQLRRFGGLQLSKDGPAFAGFHDQFIAGLAGIPSGRMCPEKDPGLCAGGLRDKVQFQGPIRDDGALPEGEGASSWFKRPVSLILAGPVSLERCQPRSGPTRNRDGGGTESKGRLGYREHPDESDPVGETRPECGLPVTGVLQASGSSLDGGRPVASNQSRRS